VDEADAFPQDVLELMAYFRGDAGPVQAVPGAGLRVPVWILGSSLFGAQLAAALGLPYAFASHFAPGQMMQAIEVYREQFRPSDQLDRPYVMLGFNVFAADTDEEGRRLFTSLQQAFVNLRRGQPGRLPPPVDGLKDRLTPAERMMIGQALSSSGVGSRDTVRRGLASFISRTGADELIVTSQIFDHAARLKSFEIVASIRDNLLHTLREGR
jgi:luciferase family oxidoreductase group 1